MRNRLLQLFCLLLGGLLLTLQSGCVSTVQYEQRLWEQANVATAKHSYETAFSFYLQAAEMGVVEAQYNVAQMYQQGVGIGVDAAKAKYWYEKAAGARLAVAQYQLSHIYWQESAEDAQQNAFDWLQRAAAAGHAQAQFELAQQYQFGRVEVDLAQAKKWYLHAAAQGIAPAQYQAALLIEREQGGLRANDSAYGWYEHAAKQDYLPAKARLGIFLAGDGRTEHLPEAVAWLKAASQEGDAASQYQLSLLYQRGKGVERNPGYAVHWLRQAANQGWVDAQYDMGVKYVRGVGVSQNNARAYDWFEKAARQGHAAAKGHLAALSSNLLFAAVVNDDVSQLRRFIDNGANINAAGASGYTPLHYAVDQGRDAIARVLLAQGANVNAKSDDGITPLFISVTKGDMQMAAILMSHGADVNSRDSKGISALDYALSGGQTQLARLLSSNGARSFAYSSAN